MPIDSDPGVGIATPIGIPAAYDPTATTTPDLCVSFHRSLSIMMIDNKGGAYGFRSPDFCDVWWKAYQREGWIDKMRSSISELKRDLGAPFCPQPIYDELHPLRRELKLRQAPVAYLGRRTFSDWTEVNLVVTASTGTFELCDQDIAPYTINDVQFSYPDDILECYNGFQALQAPCIARITTCGVGGDLDGYQISWPIYQLVRPDVDEAEVSQISDPNVFVRSIKWRTSTIDTTLAYELVGECNCTCCNGVDPELTLTLTDALEGKVCFECDSVEPCLCTNRRVRINYATAYSYGAGMDPALEEAIILYALVKSDRTPVKPCGCDNRWVDGQLEIDPTAGTDFAHRLSYGPTVAGMKVMRTMDKFLKRPHFNQDVDTGGLFSGRRLGKSGRDKSVLRGF